MVEVVSSQSPNAQYVLTGLVIRYSSWTARVVTVLEHFSIPYQFNEYNKTDEKGLKAIRSQPANLVPTLLVPSLDNVLIHDSLSILEFLAESHPTLPLWPASKRLRAIARSVTAEFHSGFGAIRNTYHSNFVAYYVGDIPRTPAIDKEVARLLVIFDTARRETMKEGVKGEYLFGEFGIADAFFWPVLWRLRTYAVDLSAATPPVREWIVTMWKDPKLRALGDTMFTQARDPATLIPQYDDIFPGKAKMEWYEKGAEYVPKF